MSPIPVVQPNTRKQHPKALEIAELVWPAFPKEGRGGAVTFGTECPPEGSETEPIETLPDAPALNPPVMRFTYPPRNHDGSEICDVNVLDKMLDDLERQGEYMTARVNERKESIAAMVRDFILADAMVEEEEREWREFLELIVKWGGPKMAAFWEDVDEEVERFRIYQATMLSDSE